MSRFGRIVLGGLVVCCPFFGCGEKDLQDYSPPTGGSTGDAGTLGQGGAGGVAGTGGTTASSGPVYANDIELLLKKYCTSCHAAGGIKPPVDTYATAKANASASNDTILDGSMPPGSTKLTATEKAHFDAWLKAGTPP